VPYTPPADLGRITPFAGLRDGSAPTGRKEVLTMSLRSSSHILATSLLAFLLTLSALAQTTAKSGLKYDPTKETKLKGTVTQVVEGASATDPTILSVKVSDKVVSVQLAPKDYLKEIECWIKAGDVVEITGAKATDSGDEIIAREVVFGNNTMVLRDNKGVPIWEMWKPSKS
jgi:hypothetical protein